MNKLRRIIRNKRVIILIIALLLAVLFIRPVFQEGVAIRSVTKDSAAAEAIPTRVPNPAPAVRPVNREVITSINNEKIHTVLEYYEAIEKIEPGQTFTLQTNKGTYYITQKLINKTIIENEQEITIQEYQEIGLNVYPRPKNNIRTGIDIEGGTRVLLEPQEPISSEDLDMTVRGMEQRLNAYGLSDISVRSTSDLFGNVYVSAEIPGVNEDEVTELLSQQGKFEAKVGQTPVFLGGERDIVFVYTSGENSRITSCSAQAGEHFCGFEFGITLSQDAARRMAAATQNLTTLGIGNEGYLSENLTLILDDEVMDELRISSSLKGQVVTSIRITGSGSGSTEKEARANTLREMRNLQAILSTGSLPVRLEVVKTDSISPALGAGFIKNAVIAGIFAIIAVCAIIAIRYKEWRITIPIIITILSEVILILGFAALIGWRMDIAAIAAIIIAVGSGVDDQIIISDETLKRKKQKSKEETESWKKRVARAFFIIMAAYFTLAVAMIPLLFAGAGLLKGFALTTIVGISMGVFITRPAFAQVLEIIIDE
ncbi:MMPL family transporter [Candidatus Woesearchaeota archaeon]|nr:MMPL family transporter [Candidatus Woesearchaeota archaeon]